MNIHTENDEKGEKPFLDREGATDNPTWFTDMIAGVLDGNQSVVVLSEGKLRGEGEVEE